MKMRFRSVIYALSGTFVALALVLSGVPSRADVAVPAAGTSEKES